MVPPVGSGSAAAGLVEGRMGARETAVVPVAGRVGAVGTAGMVGAAH